MSEPVIMLGPVYVDEPMCTGFAVRFVDPAAALGAVLDSMTYSEQCAFVHKLTAAAFEILSAAIEKKRI